MKCASLNSRPAGLTGCSMSAVSVSCRALLSRSLTTGLLLLLRGPGVADVSTVSAAAAARFRGEGSGGDAASAVDSRGSIGGVCVCVCFMWWDAG